MNKSQKPLMLVIATILIIGGIITTFALVTKDKPIMIGINLTNTKHYKYKETIIFAKQVENLIYNLNIQHPEIVYKQALYETGRFNKVSQGMRNRNLFCFSFDGTNVLRFDTWQESVYYYKFWQKYKTEYTKEDYYKHLKKYWGAPNMDTYINTLKQIK